MSRRIYYGGTIITMESSQSPDWIRCENGIITEVGTGAPKMERGDEAVDLKGHTLLPGFIDAHSHLSAVAGTFLQANVDGASSVRSVLEKIEQFINENLLKPGDWVNASGFDNNLLPESAHLTASDIDSRFPDYPVVIQHKSGHMGTFNGAAMVALGISPDTEPVAGGYIEKSGGLPTGYMEETDFVERLKKIPMPGVSEMARAFSKAQELYLKNGVTTLQEGLMVEQLLPLYGAIRDAGGLTVDVVGYPDMESLPKFENAFPQCVGKYSGHLRLGGVKIILDGSPQGRTAWMRAPYEGETEYSGYPAVTDEKLLEAAKFAASKGIQLLAHCNGDMAAQQFLNAVEKTPGLEKPVLIHGQLLGKDQLGQVKRLHVIPSFFIAHVYYWGDVHVQNFGAVRANGISPARSCIERDIVFTFHQDSPVVMPDMLETVWCAVNRITKGGIALGEDERISPIEALKAVTINAAYQYSEEDAKGSISPGKLENLVILDADPTSVSPEKIRDIHVVQTIISGKTMFSA